MEHLYHSVILDSDKCIGCINCIKNCPTEAIRVRNQKAIIITERCIDCGECIRICPYHAKKALSGSLDVLSNYEYNIALPTPALYGQFNNIDDIEIVLRPFLQLGFDAVYDVSKACEIISDATRKYLADPNVEKPVISSACPAVTRLIRMRFPNLLDKLLPFNSPEEVAAKLARERAMEKTGLPAEKIGTVLISACPAKVTAMKMPIGIEKSNITSVVSISDIYPKLLKFMAADSKPNENAKAESGRIGVGWASSSGEAAALLTDNYLYADGIQNVTRVLEDLDDEKFETIDFIELNACSAGCIGGVLAIENPYVARAKLRKTKKYLPVSLKHEETPMEAIKWEKSVEYLPVTKLDEDFSVAMMKMQQIDDIASMLPGLDCGSCGAPSCHSLAEDVINGSASVDSCVFKSRFPKKIKE